MIRSPFIALLCAALLFATGVRADATKMPVPSIAIVDIQRILQESMAAKSVQKQLDAQRAKFQSETEAEENGLRQSEQDLGKSRDHIAADLYTEREQQLRQRFLAVERKVEDRRKALETAFTDSMNDVRAHLLDIVQAVAKAHGVNLVLVKQEALWTDPTFDVTDEVLGQLNKSMPQAAVKMPAEEKP